MICTQVDILPKKDQYEKFLLKTDKSLIYHSLKFRDFLKSFIEAEDRYLVAKDNGSIVGVFPCFIKHNERYGNVLNSLPFYGSNGGIIVDETLPRERKEQVKKELLQKFYELEDSCACISSTIVTSFFESDAEFYKRSCIHQQRDSRIGQVVMLPEDRGNIRNVLFYDHYCKNLRRDIRKAEKGGIQIFESHQKEDLCKLYDIHRENILALGGIPKPFSMFENLSKCFEYGNDYKVFFGTKDGKIVSGLLLLYFNKTVEYYVPAVVEEYRPLESNTMLIYESMIDAIKRGYKYYNFGGTWGSQQGVYKFKKKWGAGDLAYTYYINLKKDVGYFRRIGKERLLEEYKYFYVTPFSALEAA